MEQKLFNFNFDELGDKVKDLMGKAGELASESKEKIEAAIDDLQSDITAAQSSFSIKAEEYKGQAFGELLKAQMNFNAQSEKIKDEIELRAGDIKEGTKGAKAQAAGKYADLMASFADIVAKEAAKAKMQAELINKKEEE